MAMIITAFAQQIGNMGFENFYLQEKIENEKHERKILNITFKLRILVNILLFIIQFFGSYLVVQYFNEQIVGELLRIFSFEYLIMAVTQVNLYILRKKLEYKPEVVANLSRDIFGTFSKVFFAYLGFGALSFAIGSLIGGFVRMIIILKYQSFKPDLKDWDKKIFSKVFFFGKHSFILGIGNYFTNQIDKIFLATFFPKYLVGIYNFSNNQSQNIFSMLLSSQASLIVSYSSKYKEYPKELFQKLTLISYLIGLVTLPIVLFITIYTNEIVTFIFTEKWIDTVIYIKTFLLYYLITEITFPISGLLTAYGVPQIASKIVLTRFLFLLVGLSISVYLSDNILNYLIVFIIISFIFTWIKAYYSLKQMNVSLISYLKEFIPLIFFFVTYYLIYFLITLFEFNKIFEIFIFSINIILFFLLLNITIFKQKFILILKLILKNENSIFLKIIGDKK